jgi:hypothetical protein
VAHIRGEREVADRAAVLIRGGLRERDVHLHLAGPGSAVLALAGPTLGFGHRHADPVAQNAKFGRASNGQPDDM